MESISYKNVPNLEFLLILLHQFCFSQTFDFLKYIISKIGFLGSDIDFTNF